jgi:hypothetical protein
MLASPDDHRLKPSPEQPDQNPQLVEKPSKNLGYAAGADVQAFAVGLGGLSTNVVEMSLRELLGTVEAFIPMPAW